MKKLFFLFISTCLYFTGHTQDELNKSESEIRELSGDFQVEENSDSLNADGVYRTIIYMNKRMMKIIITKAFGNMFYAMTVAVLPIFILQMMMLMMQ
jgi:hypothetical protein